MSSPNSWCPVQVINKTGLTLTEVTLKHRYDDDHYDEKSWSSLPAGGVGDGLTVGFWTGFGRTGNDYWHIRFKIGGAVFTCKDNFYCYLTRDDVGGLVKIELFLTRMHVAPPESSSADVTVTHSGFWTANAELGYYNIAHMVNTPAAVDWGVGKGANGLEADLNFNAAGSPTVWKHGGAVSDCTCNPFPSSEHVCSVVGKDDATPAADLLRHIAGKPHVALHIVDTKMTDDVDQGAAGRNVIHLLETELFGRGYAGNVIVGVGDTKYLPYIQSAAHAAAASAYAARISFTFDGEGGDVGRVFGALAQIGSKHRVYGTGITVCSPATYFDAISDGCVAEHHGAQGLTYVWTLDKESSMVEYLAAGARGILTNMPGHLRALLAEKGLKLAAPGTLIPPAK